MIFSVCSKLTFHNYIISILSRLIVCFPIFEQYHARKEIVGKNRGSKEVCGNIVSCNSLSLFFFFQHFRTNCMLPWHRLYLHFHVVSDLHRLCETQSRNNFSRRKFIISFIPEVSNKNQVTFRIVPPNINLRFVCKRSFSSYRDTKWNTVKSIINTY